jgi:microcystin-dependent protein
MSINNLEFTSYNYLSNLASVNADEVNTNILTKSDPDISDLQFDMLEGINTNETIQEQIDNVSVDITGLEADVLTLQGEMNTAQDDINDLQADVIALGVTVGATAATVAGLVISQAAQDATLATHTAQIGTLQGEMNDVEDDINTLQTKTQHQSATGFRTVFSSTVEVGGVTLNTASASTFDDGLTASDPIVSTAGTSQFSSLLVNTTAEITNDFTITNGTQFITRNTLTSNKKLVLYDNTTGSDYDYLGFWTDSGTASKKFLNSEIDGVAGSAFQWYYGNNLNSARTLAKSLSSSSEIGYTESAKFLKSSGFSQEINLIRDTANNRVRIDMLGDTNGLNTFDGQIIQEEGNGVDDNTGTMTIQSGGLAINALDTGLNIQATTSTLIQSGTTTTLTSDGETEINCDILDINVVGQTTFDTTQLALNATTGNMTCTTSATGDFNITSGRDINFSTNSTGGITNCSSNKDQDILRINNTAFDSKFLIGSATTGFRQTVNNNSYANLNSLGTTQLNLSTSNASMSLVSTGGALNLNRTGTSNTLIGNATGTFTLNGSTNSITGTTNSISGTTNTILGTTNINRTGTSTTSIGNTGALTLNGSTYNLTTTSNQTYSTGSTANIEFTAGDFLFTSTGTGAGEFVVRANTNIDLRTTTGDIELNATTTMLLRSAGANTIRIDATDKMVTNDTTTTITNNTVAINGATTITGATTINGNTSINVDNTFNMMPTATIIQNMSATIPAGFLYCNGGNISRTAYARLFAAIGTAFGVGDGSTTFGKPNLTGAYLRGTSGQTVGGVTYTGPAIGTAQQDAVLNPLYASNEGFFNTTSGGATRECVARSRITADPVDTNTGILPRFDRTATENRPFNYSVYYYIRY